MKVTVRLPAEPGVVWTAEAVAGLIGQRPTITRNFDWIRTFGRCTVTDARLLDDGSVELALDGVRDEARTILGTDREPYVSVGYRPLAWTEGEATLADRAVTAVDLVELGPAPHPPTTTKALVGPLPRVHFWGGPRDLAWHERPWVVYDTPRNTLDPRYRTCRDHRVACDCREAEFAEERGEWQAFRDDVRLAEQLVAGHHEDCACTGCKMVRLMGHEYDPRWSRGRQPEPDVALVLRADAAKKQWHVHCRHPLLPGVCKECLRPFPCRDRREAHDELDDVARAWPALVDLALCYTQPEEQPHVLVYGDDVDSEDRERECSSLTDALEFPLAHDELGDEHWPIRLERRAEGATTLVLVGDALRARIDAVRRAPGE